MIGTNTDMLVPPKRPLKLTSSLVMRRLAVAVQLTFSTILPSCTNWRGTSTPAIAGIDDDVRRAAGCR